MAHGELHDAVILGDVVKDDERQINLVKEVLI